MESIITESESEMMAFGKQIGLSANQEIFLVLLVIWAQARPISQKVLSLEIIAISP